VERYGEISILQRIRFSCLPYVIHDSIATMKQDGKGTVLNIADVAKLSGASKATVSRVLTGNANVRPETKDRILAVINEYGYVPNRFAQALAGNSTKMIGIVISELANFFFTEVAQGIDSVLSPQGYFMLMSFTDWNEKKELEAVSSLIKNNVDGVILSASSPASPAIALLLESGIPFVVVNCIPSDSSVPFVTGDNYMGGKLVADFVQKGSYGQIAIVTGFDDQPMKLRYQGFTENYKGECEYLHFNNVPTLEEGYAFGERILQLRKPILVFVTNDNVAIGLENSLAERVRIPQDVAIIGYDDIKTARYCKVPLTTIAQNIFAMGENAAELLLHIIRKESVPEPHVLVKPHLVVRESAR